MPIKIKDVHFKNHKFYPVSDYNFFFFDSEIWDSILEADFKRTNTV